MDELPEFSRHFFSFCGMFQNPAGIYFFFLTWEIRSVLVVVWKGFESSKT